VSSAQRRRRSSERRAIYSRCGLQATLTASLPPSAHRQKPPGASWARHGGRPARATTLELAGKGSARGGTMAFLCARRGDVEHHGMAHSHRRRHVASRVQWSSGAPASAAPRCLCAPAAPGSSSNDSRPPARSRRWQVASRGLALRGVFLES
jgi:hypothetical protein